jgi:rhodanese-related sulfurtransferase
MTRDIEIEPIEVELLLKQKAIKLLDVRTAMEYSIAHIDGSILIDQGLVEEIVSSWPKETDIVTLCHHGIRSLDAAAYFRAQGFSKVRSMRGGIDVWSAQIDPSVPRY